jgi:energy-coupling factor transport system ATP-binding protein
LTNHPEQHSFCVQADHLTFTYPGGDAPVLNDLSFRIPTGQFVALLGANGCGKSTLAKLLAGLLTPNSGTLKVLDYDTSRPSSINALRGRVGIVFQSPDEQMVATTVEREIAFGMENLGIEPAQIRLRVEELLQRFDLKPYAKRSPHLLSGGEKQRLALASVLAMQPQFLILDEVTSLLDPAGRRSVQRKFPEMRRECTLLLITQFPGETASADRLWIMDRGAIIADGPPGEIFRKAASKRIAGVNIPPLFELLHAAENPCADPHP